MPLASYDAEMTEVEGEGLAAVSLGAGDHARVGEPEGEVRVPDDEFANSTDVLLAALQREAAGFEVREETVERRRSQAGFDQVRDLGEDSRRNEIRPPVLEECCFRPFVVRVAAVEQSENPGGVERDQARPHSFFSQSSESAAESSESSPVPRERNPGRSLRPRYSSRAARITSACVLPSTRATSLSDLRNPGLKYTVVLSMTSL